MAHEVRLVYLPGGAVKAVKAADGTRHLDVLGVPFGGPLNGRDLDGQAFTPDTKLWMEVGDSRPALYYHGFAPDGNPEPDPEIMAMATVTGVDERGWHFDVPLPPAGQSEYADRVYLAAEAGTARASSGAMAHLVRDNKMTGAINLWPIGELSLFDANPDEGRMPANDWAVAMPVKSFTKRFDSLGLKVPQALLGSGEELESAMATDPIAETDITDQAGTVPAAKQADVEGTPMAMTPEEIKAVAEASSKIVLDGLKAQADLEAKAAADREALKAEVRKEVEAEFVPARQGGFYVKRVTDLGLAKDQVKAFTHWVRTGDEGAVKGAGLAVKLGANELVETDADASHGEYLVPEDWRTQIIEKRDEKSIARAMGAMVITTSSDVVKFPTESTGQTEFGIVAEEGSHIAQLDNPVIGQEGCVIYKFSKTTKVTDELIEDSAANLEKFLINSFARKQALTENKYVLAGSGVAQPEGILAGGTSAFTSAGAAALTAAEVKSLFYKLGEYRDNCAWVAQTDTESAIRSLTGNPFAFDETPGGKAASFPGVGVLMGKPIFNSAYMEALAATKKALAIGNWEYFGLAERSGLAIKRLNELYADAGYIGLRATFRFGSQVLQADAFQYITQHV